MKEISYEERGNRTPQAMSEVLKGYSKPLSSVVLIGSNQVGNTFWSTACSIPTSSQAWE